MTIAIKYGEHRYYRRFKYLLTCSIIWIISLAVSFGLTLSGDLLRILPFSVPISLIISIPIYYLIRGRFFGGIIGKTITAIQNLKDTGHFGSGGNARFAGMFEEYLSTKRGKTAIYYGRSLFSRSWKIFGNDDRHMLTIGGARTGKGAACIIPNLLLWSGSVLCIDPKGTNANVTAAHRRKMGQLVHIVDPFNVIPNEDSAHFNPLDIIDPSSLTVTEDIRIITEALVVSEGSENNIHFVESARSLIDGYIVHVVTSGDYENPSLIDVFDILNLSFSEAIDIHARMMANPSCNGLASQTAKRILDGHGSNEFNSVVATAKTNLKWLSSEAIKQSMSHSSFRFETMKDTPTSVFLIIPPDLLSTHSRFLRLFVNIATNRYTRGGKAEICGLFIIDECPALGHMEQIQKAYGELASYNLIVWTFFQDKGQLDTIYGERAQTFIGSSRAVQVFSVRDTDAEWVASMIGTKGSGYSAQSNQTTAITAFRDSTSIEKEIGHYSAQQYIFRAGKNPLILGLLPYFKSWSLAPDASKDPDHPWPPKAHVIGKILRPVTYLSSPLKIFKNEHERVSWSSIWKGIRWIGFLPAAVWCTLFVAGILYTIAGFLSFNVGFLEGLFIYIATLPVPTIATIFAMLFAPTNKASVRWWIIVPTAIYVLVLYVPYIFVFLFLDTSPPSERFLPEDFETLNTGWLVFWMAVGALVGTIAAIVRKPDDL